MAVQVAAERRIGRQTLVFPTRPALLAVGSVVGPFEGRGPLGHLFDEITPDSLLGQKSWEQAEVKMLERAVYIALNKAGLQPGDVDVLVSGDLMNQITASCCAARTLDRPFFGIFGACSCWTEAITLGAALVDGGYAARAVVATSSHHNTAERQFRYPTEFGAQRPPTATWTVTGAAAAVIAAGAGGPRVTHATVGRVVDIGLKDPFDLGSAMAPAAADTIVAHLRDTGRLPEDYDLIITGDLGRVGKPIAAELIQEAGFNVTPVFDDCGLRIYSADQDVHGGGSGCACSGATFAAQIWPDLAAGRLRRVLLAATGALFSPTTYQQGESIPGIAYAVAIEALEGGRG